MGSLFCYGGGIFFFFDGLASAEREDILQDPINRQQKVLGPEPMARRLIEEFRQELEQARLSYAGVEHRRCSLEKTGVLVRERLSQALMQVRDDTSAFVDQLLHGDQVHGALKGDEIDLEEFSNDPSFTCGNFSSLSLVQEGAEVLSALDAEALFINDSISVSLYTVTARVCRP